MQREAFMINLNEISLSFKGLHSITHQVQDPDLYKDLYSDLQKVQDSGLCRDLRLDLQKVQDSGLCRDLCLGRKEDMRYSFTH